MKTSEDGIAFIKAREGFNAQPRDDNGHPEWGFGHDQRCGEVIPMSITLVDADALLRSDLPLYFEPHVNSLAPWAKPESIRCAGGLLFTTWGPAALATMLHHGREQVTVADARVVLHPPKRSSC